MHLLITVAVVLQVISAVAIIVLVLLQHGKGADMGAAFGGGAPALFSGPQEAPTSFPVLLLLLPRFSSALHWR